MFLGFSDFWVISNFWNSLHVDSSQHSASWELAVAVCVSTTGLVLIPVEDPHGSVRRTNSAAHVSATVWTLRATFRLRGGVRGTIMSDSEYASALVTRGDRMSAAKPLSMQGPQLGNVVFHRRKS